MGSDLASRRSPGLLVSSGGAREIRWSRRALVRLGARHHNRVETMGTWGHRFVLHHLTLDTDDKYRIRFSTILTICLSTIGVFDARAQDPSHARMSRIGSDSSLIREVRRVVVDSVIEEWWLEWRTPPVPACDSGYELNICPCDGFAFGEEGELDLVRKAQGRAEERLPLTPYFKSLGERDLAILPKWPRYRNDEDSGDSAGLLRRVRSRPIVSIMNFEDYDHDGRMTEFVLQIDARACGHRQAILVGISRQVPHLHVFGTVAHPSNPIVLQHPEEWTNLLKSRGHVTLVEWPCGDHGGELESDYELLLTPGGIRAFETLRSCGNDSLAQHPVQRLEF